ncbi:hypothetical protein HPB51_013487 [Rhipicephalus microplus]|uniref:BZIP domain-containing protein n=1 Tax=Rhipicephalus microplus TaxID=6941 RepID=A0A9J6ENH2_RHIMP|nr:transcription factor AP-1-like [Rhipicephalus microplus]KAH8035946.1 hypothetical protein HPB51_013487 [Rhipicephalus microplus]
MQDSDNSSASLVPLSSSNHSAMVGRVPPVGSSPRSVDSDVNSIGEGSVRVTADRPPQLQQPRSRCDEPNPRKRTATLDTDSLHESHSAQVRILQPPPPADVSDPEESKLEERRRKNRIVQAMLHQRRLDRTARLQAQVDALERRCATLRAELLARHHRMVRLWQHVMARVGTWMTYMKRPPGK